MFGPITSAFDSATLRAGITSADGEVRRRFARRSLLSILIGGICLIALPGASRAADVGFSVTANDYPAHMNDGNFTTLMSAMGVKYLRFFVNWETFGAATSSGACTTPTAHGSEEQQLGAWVAIGLGRGVTGEDVCSWRW